MPLPALNPQISDSPSSNLVANTKKTFKTYDTTTVYQIEHYPEVVEKRFPRRGHTRWGLG